VANCPAGTGGDTCTTCAAGYASAGGYSAVCQACTGRGYTTAAGASACLTCPDNMNVIVENGLNVNCREWLALHEYGVSNWVQAPAHRENLSAKRAHNPTSLTLCLSAAHNTVAPATVVAGAEVIASVPPVVDQTYADTMDQAAAMQRRRCAFGKC
jgi:hypothetical protein